MWSLLKYQNTGKLLTKHFCSGDLPKHFFFFFFLISSSLEFTEGFHLLLQIHCHNEDIKKPTITQEIL